jgi:glycerol-3-phosphate dehydrogenase (NAD(P)+)
MVKVGVIGAGSWGTALALVLHDNGYEVTLWSKEVEHIAELKATGENAHFLPGVKLPDGLHYTADLQTAAAGADFLVMVVPSHAMKPVAADLQGLVDEKTVFISAAKGFDVQTHARMSEVLAAAFPKNSIAVLSGPSHAEEVSRRIPTAIVSAASEPDVMKAVQELFSNSYMRVYANPDVIGVELGGSLKNIIALASGICYGLGCGDNTEAAVLTRGLTEIVRLGVCMGAEKSTFYGLSGMGDLVVTCGSRHSRNRTAGIMLGEGKKLQEVLSEMGMVVEGINATQIAHVLAAEYGVEMPITDSIYRVLYENVPIDGVVNALMQRDKKAE